MEEQAATENKGPGRPKSKIRREEKANPNEYKTMLIEPYMHRDLKKVSALLGKNMREFLEEVFYANEEVAKTLEKIKKLEEA
ncbi:hypothetical protein F5984_23960 [Rudanella paleaurantiibacter]|uniref:Uncharacterized protein n=1 Tax=Rudanella paleaurantiibacter TaxID=2614655 RepID=A0A7J5TSW5_9BACT|nr:hypothetical protein [Rudanella paleaurantiibacter]KAB7726686.1 hypothetical protein F5984_23960 [Rudanella paleaurantiibacter]